MSAVPKPILDAERYLALEREAPEKSQFYRGEMFAMAGASAKHNLIVANIIGELRSALRQSDCRVFASDLRVAIDAASHYVYPDAVIVCGEPKYLDDKFDTLLNPTLLVEVLSDSLPNATARDGWGLKFSGYRSLPSVNTVVLVSQDRQAVDVYSRQNDDEWLLRAFQSPGDSRIMLPHLAIEIPLADVYRGAEISEPPTRELG
jgi:Uma2 family endonuclease